MGRDRLNEGEADDVLSGRRPAGREGQDPLDDLIAVLHASRELEPPPPMSPGLSAAVHRGRTAGAVPRPVAVPAAADVADDEGAGVAAAGEDPIATVRVLPRGAKRAVASVAAAAVVLVGVVLASLSGGNDRAAELPASGTTLPEAYAPQPVPRQPSTGGDAVLSSVPGETTTIPPTTSSSVAPAAPAAPPSSPPADTGDDQDGERRRDGDGDGDPDQFEGDGRRRTEGADEPDDTADDRSTTGDTEASTSTTSTTTPTSSTTSTTGPDVDGESWPGSTTSTTDDWRRHRDSWMHDLFDAFGR